MANEIVADLIIRLERAEKEIEKFKKRAKKDGAEAGENLAAEFDKAVDSFKSLASGGGGGIQAFIGNLKSLAGPMAGIAAGAILAKEAVESIFKGEELVAAQKQFEIFATRAGEVPEHLLASFDAAAAGMIDTSDIIVSANKALIELGDNAEKLPQILELSRKVTSIHGGEVTENFEKMNQAISSGNTRALRQLGIFIDSDMALRKFAESMGVTVQELSQAGKQQAILNALLEQGTKAFAGVDVNIRANANEWEKLKVKVKDAAEKIQQDLFHLLGPALKANLKGLNSAMDSVGGALESDADKAKKAADNADVLTDSMMKLAKQSRETGAAMRASFTNPISKEELDRIRAALQASNTQTISLQAQLAQAQGDSLAAENLRKEQIEQAHTQRLLALRQQFNTQALQQTAEFKQMEKNLNDQKNLEMQLADQRRLAAMSALNRNVQNAMVKTTSMAIQNVGGSLVKGANAWEGFGQAVFGLLGDMAIQTGETMILMGGAMEAVRASIVGLVGGPSIFAGIALIALGGLLKALSGGGGGGGGAGDGGGGGGAAAGGGIAGTTDITELSDTEKKGVGPQVTFEIQGNILDRKQTGLELAEIMTETLRTNDVRFNV